MKDNERDMLDKMFLDNLSDEEKERLKILWKKKYDKLKRQGIKSRQEHFYGT